MDPVVLCENKLHTLIQHLFKAEQQEEEEENLMNIKPKMKSNTQ